MQSTSRDLGSGVRNGSFYQVRSRSLPVWLGSSFKGGLEERFQAGFLAGGLIVIVSLTSNLLKGVSPPDCGLLAVNVAKRVIFGGCEKIHSKSGWRSTFAELTIIQLPFWASKHRDILLTVSWSILDLIISNLDLKYWGYMHSLAFTMF